MAQDPLISEKESIKVEEASKKDAASFDAVQYIKKNKGKQFQHKEKANKDKESDDDNNVEPLFKYYSLDGERLQPQDLRKLLLDILAAYDFPQVVPDESLNEVLNEICLNDEGNISFVEFKTFFVFLHDDPLGKLFTILTNDKVKLNKTQIGYSRVVTIRPVRAKQDNDDNKEPQKDGDEAPKDGDKESKPSESNEVDQKASEQSEEAKKNYYDRNKWKSAVQNLVPEATQIFVYFVDGYQILALAIGESFEAPLAEPAAAELKLDDVTYLATIRAFEVDKDMFPPIARSGGMKSKVARRIADSYLIARQWDEKHLKLVEKGGQLVHKISVKWTEFDEKYKVNERVNATTTSIINSVKAFDEKHQLTRRLSASAKQLNDKFGITQKLGNVADKIKDNEKVQIVSNKVNESFKAVVKTVDDIGTETQQLVQEKRQAEADKNDGNNQNQNEGDQQAQPQQEYGNDNDAAPVVVQEQ